MQFAVPQFTEIEDKIIGPLTLKQFLILLATGGLVLFFYSILKLSFFFFILGLPVALLGIALAFLTYNGRALYTYTGAILTFFLKPRSRVFKREDVNISMSFKAEAKEPIVADKMREEVTESRLKKLAYLLDQQAQQEKELLKPNKPNG